MSIYSCKKCKSEKEITRVNLIYLEDKKKWEAREALCDCGNYMQSKNKNGFPSLIRTEKSLKKN
tara:strand:+ start:71 stop:262 length:192 start_codon:yes stop_codon:yes gene_type:complete